MIDSGYKYQQARDRKSNLISCCCIQNEGFLDFNFSMYFLFGLMAMLLLSPKNHYRHKTFYCWKRRCKYQFYADKRSILLLQTGSRIGSN